MKPLFNRTLFVACILVTSFKLAAQPVLNASNTNPVTGEHFYTYWCDTSAFSASLTGAGVTWNFGSLAILSADTIDVVPCVVTPYCDSFAGSTLAEFTHSNHSFWYFDAGPASLAITGQYFPYPWPTLCYFTMPYNFFVYPFTYGNTQVDSYIYNVPINYQTNYVRDTAIADGYGTLILPTGTYTNVLRVKHSFRTRAVHYNYGITDYYTQVWYSWSMPGSHEPLLSYFDDGKDTAGNIFAPKLVKFSTAIPLGVEQYNAVRAIDIYPNPASNSVHVKGLHNILTTVVTVIDVTGRVVNAVAALSNDEVVIHTDGLADGLYMIRIQTDEGVVLRKLQVAH